MASNTKLSQDQKDSLKFFKDEMPKNMVFGQSGRVTVLVQLTGNVMRFSTAVASPDEKKLRRKVGQYHAADRWTNGEISVAPVPPKLWDGERTDPEYVANLLADALNAL